MLNNREIATSAWLLVTVAAVAAHPSRRRKAASMIRVLLGVKLLLPLILLVAWLVVLVRGAAMLGWWERTLVGDTVVAASSTLLLMFSFDRAVKENRYFRRIVLNAVTVTAFAATFINLHTFSLPVELVAQPVLVMLALMSFVAGREEQLGPVKRLVDTVLTVVGLVVLVAVTRTFFVTGFHRDDLLAFALPVWMTLGALPMLYLVWLYAAYDGVFTWVAFVPGNDGRRIPLRARLRARLALLLVLRGRIRTVGAFPADAVWRVREATSLRSAIAVATERRHRLVARPRRRCR